MRALLLAKAGREREALEAAARAIEIGSSFGHFHHTAYNIAATHAALGDLDAATGWLEVAADDGFPCYPYFARDPNLGTLRACPRFVALLSVLHKQWTHFRGLLSPSP